MNPHPRQRSHPPVAIQGSFGPYDRRELEAARAQLIRDVYTSNAGGILARVKMKCGIVANSSGNFTGCEPHWVTNVSYESQSCSLMMEDSFPWVKEASPSPKADDDEHVWNGNTNQEAPSSSEMRSQRIYRQDTNSTYGQSSNSPSTSSCMNTNRQRSSENVEDISERPSKMRKLDRDDDKIGGNPAAYGNYNNSNRASPSLNTNRGRQQDNIDNTSTLSSWKWKLDYGGRDVKGDQGVSTPQGPNSARIQEPSIPSTSTANTNEGRRQKKIECTTEKAASKTNLQDDEEEEGIIISSSEDDIDTSLVIREETVPCYKCDLCDYVMMKGEYVRKHLQDKVHYSASRYVGTLKGDTVVPKYLEKSMEYQYKPAQFHSVLPICPRCYAVFHDIHSCSIHSQKFHGLRKPVYSLGRIRESKETFIFSKPKCHVCKMSFDKISSLNSHMKHLKHYTHRAPGSSEAVAFVCTYCEKPSIYEGHQQHMYREHLRTSHGTKTDRLAMRIVYIEKPKEVKEILPRIARSEKRDVQSVYKPKRKPKVKMNKFMKKRMHELTKKYTWTKGQNHSNSHSRR